MKEPELRREYVWPATLRIAHWLMAISIVGLMISGWIQSHVPQLYQTAFEYHLIFAHALVLALIIRLYLLFTAKNNPSSWREFKLDKTKVAGLIAVFKFYVTFARYPLPNWYAHNPFWLPVYIAVFSLVFLQIINGYLLFAGYYLLVFEQMTLHIILAKFFTGFVVLHIIAVVLQDLKGSGSDISAMISGYRIFLINKASVTSKLNPQNQPVTFTPPDNNKVHTDE